MKPRHILALTTAALLGTVAAGASAATLSGSVQSGPTPAAGTSDTPLAGATVTVFAADARGSRRLGAATTDATGAFTITYPRAPRGSTLYAVARGGAVGSGTAPARALRLMSVVGPASAPLDTVTINELSTVASTYALVRFIRGGAVRGPAPGLPNAALTAANLVDMRTGKPATTLANAPNGLATEALPTVNTLANVLVRCVRGTRADCTRLFTAARGPGQALPRDTTQALVNLALRPTTATRRLVGMQQQRAFTPRLRRAPAAWTIALVHTDGGFDAPGRMAFDSRGRIWSNNNWEPPTGSPGRGLTVLDGAGRPILGSPLRGGGLEGSGFGIAVDTRDRVWVANFHGSSMSLFSPNGRPLTPATGAAHAVLDQPQTVAVDRRDNVWVANSGNDTVTRFPRGNLRAPQVISGGGLSRPFGIAIDSRGNAWVTNGSESATPAASSSVTKIRPDGTIDPISPITGGGLLSPQAIAVDSADNLWVANFDSNTVTVIDRNGRITPSSPIRTRGLRGPWGIAVDGADTVWVAGFRGRTLVQLCGRRTASCPPGSATGAALSPPGGYVSAALQHPTAVQVDSSGNVWLANNWSNGTPLSQFVGGNGLVQFVGLATPVKTPLIGLPRTP